ncbi:MAG: C4-dicarboxylate ABC transporter [Methyloprofundus sp.]|nr:C4-dicarboxylate ABC transporter [Methyloprofundus sp.]
MQKLCDSIKLYTGIILGMFCWVPLAYAMESMTFSVAKITADDWSLNNAVLAITHLNQASPQISLVSAKLVLPPPLNSITSIDIHCKQFNWHKNYLDCSQGQGRLDSEQFKTLPFEFSLQFKDDKSNIEISQLSLFGGKISIHAQELAEKWQVHINAQSVNLAELNALFALDLYQITQGLADFEIEIKGEQDNMQELFVSALVKQLSVHDREGTVASENILMESEFSAFKQQLGWQWHNKNSLLAGGLYIDPVYLELDKKKALTLSANGFWQLEQKTIQIDRFKLEHPQVLILQGGAKLNHQTELSIELADLSIHVPQLKSAAPIYLLPFLESSAFDQIDLTGAIDARLSIEQDSVHKVSIIVKNLGLGEPEKRLSIKQANAQINWTKQKNKVQQSFINWQQLNVYAIPFQAGQLDFISFDKQLKLLHPANLAVLGGLLSVNNFSFSAAEEDDDATVHFDGSINNLSLEQLTKSLNWTPLTGTISGYIPSVRYQKKTLSLGGVLKMQVFDGEVRIKNLASSGLFSDFPQFYTDIEFDHLDLAAITQKFDTGYIEGRLSGTVQKLYLENWQPVSFYAWIGTPENDNSNHRISQKAVENIASIGGGGVSDVLSRGFLGLFSTFGYNKLGFGCYLYQGVCQLMGVEAVDNGFYLIKGGGLPRIDVIGYNSRLDWNVFVNRLNRIAASDEAIVE